MSRPSRRHRHRVPQVNICQFEVLVLAGAASQGIIAAIVLRYLLIRMRCVSCPMQLHTQHKGPMHQTTPHHTTMHTRCVKPPAFYFTFSGVKPKPCPFSLNKMPPMTYVNFSSIHAQLFTRSPQHDTHVCAPLSTTGCTCTAPQHCTRQQPLGSGPRS